MALAAGAIDGFERCLHFGVVAGIGRRGEVIGRRFRLVGDLHGIADVAARPESAYLLKQPGERRGVGGRFSVLLAFHLLGYFAFGRGNLFHPSGIICLRLAYEPESEAQSQKGWQHESLNHGAYSSTQTQGRRRFSEAHLRLWGVFPPIEKDPGFTCVTSETGLTSIDAMATPVPGNYEETLELWRSRLRDAQVQHSEAVKKYRRAARDYKVGALPCPDGGLALRQALRAESLALEEYMRVVIIFNDFLIRGQPSPKI